MNRYVKDGLLSDALSGKRVAVIEANRTELRAAFQDIASEPVVSVQSVRRSNGRERVTFAGGGSISFLTPSAVRGHQADVVYVRGWNDLTESQRDDIVPMVLRGELIRA